MSQARRERYDLLQLALQIRQHRCVDDEADEGAGRRKQAV